MTDKQLIYFPYKTHTFFAAFLSIISLLSVFTAGIVISNRLWAHWFFFTIIGIASHFTAKYMFDVARMAVVIDQSGIQIIGIKGIAYAHLYWNEMPYGYYVRSYKNHLFLVLSGEEMLLREARHVANRSAVKSRLLVGDKVAIYIDLLQDTALLKNIVRQYVTNLYGDPQSTDVPL